MYVYRYMYMYMYHVYRAVILKDVHVYTRFCMATLSPTVTPQHVYNTLQAKSHYSSHKPIGIYTRGLILGVNTNFCLFWKIHVSVAWKVIK